MNQDSLKNQFLLAMPALFGDYFAGTITYICDHTDKGASGIVVNRPLPLSLADLLTQLELPCTIDGSTPVVDGGPVHRERGFILHSDDVGFTTSERLDHGLMLTTTLDVLEAIGRGAGPRQFLVALGCAGWGASQLESELEQNAWVTCPGSKSVIFDVPFEDRVNAAANILGIDISLMSGRIGNA